MRFLSIVFSFPVRKNIYFEYRVYAFKTITITLQFCQPNSYVYANCICTVPPPPRTIVLFRRRKTYLFNMPKQRLLLLLLLLNDSKRVLVRANITAAFFYCYLLLLLNSFSLLVKPYKRTYFFHPDERQGRACDTSRSRAPVFYYLKRGEQTACRIIKTPGVPRGRKRAQRSTVDIWRAVFKRRFLRWIGGNAGSRPGNTRRFVRLYWHLII